MSSKSFTARPGSPEAAALIADLVRSGDLIPGRRSSADFVLVSKLRQLSMTQRGFARWLQMDVVTVNRWATGRVSIPHWADLLLDLMIERQQTQPHRTN